jgi:hypothetical protein
VTFKNVLHHHKTPISSLPPRHWRPWWHLGQVQKPHRSRSRSPVPVDGGGYLSPDRTVVFLGEGRVRVPHRTVFFLSKKCPVRPEPSGTKGTVMQKKKVVTVRKDWTKFSTK